MGEFLSMWILSQKSSLKKRRRKLRCPNTWKGTRVDKAVKAKKAYFSKEEQGMFSRRIRSWPG